MVWSLGKFVVRRGMHEPERALQALHAMTQRFSAEFAIRPFIATHPVLCFETLARCTRDESAHVRSLVSEGSRPRLPWGMRLTALVANHLNDIAKDHPAVVADWLTSHLPGAGKERTALLRHASRTLIKSGDARVGASRSRWT